MGGIVETTSYIISLEKLCFQRLLLSRRESKKGSFIFSFMKNLNHIVIL